jgi:hypothetical protein
MVDVALPWCAALSKSVSGCSSAIWRSDRFSTSPSSSADVFNLYPLPEAAGPSSCRVASLVTWAMTTTSIPPANRSHSELSALSGVRTSTMGAPRKKRAPNPTMNASLPPPPEQVSARQCKDDPCRHPPEWRAPGVNASRNSSGKGQRSPEQGLPPTQRCRESRSRVELRSHHGSRGNSRPRLFGRAKLDTVCQE